MIKLPDQNDGDFQKQFCSFKSRESSWLQRSSIDKNYSIWRCEITEIPGAIAFWVGHLPEFFSYLALKPVVHGSESGYEAFRAWTDPSYRGQGFASELLAASVGSSKIFSDHNGMSCAAYNLWCSRKNLNIRYFDGDSNVFVPLKSIPNDDLFTPFEQGRRWYMVLENNKINKNINKK